MRKSARIAAALGLLPTLFLAVAAPAAVLTFDDGCAGVCGIGAEIVQGYGDIAGQLDVQYDADLRTGSLENLRFWDANYAPTSGVAYGEGSSATAGVSLIPTAGYQVRLNSFLIAGWNVNRTADIRLFQIGNATPLIDLPGASILHGTGRLFDSGWDSATGFRIEFGPDAYNTGIDNISYEVAPVPLPAAAWLLLSGLAGVGAFARRAGRRVRDAA